MEKEWRQLILTELQAIRKDMDVIKKEFHHQAKAIAELKVRAGVWNGVCVLLLGLTFYIFNLK